jgi:hypothetical protein
VARLELAAQVAVLAGEPRQLKAARDERDHGVVIEGLLDEVERAVAHRVHGALDRAVRADEDHRHVRRPRLDLCQHLKPIHLWHLEVC